MTRKAENLLELARIRADNYPIFVTPAVKFRQNSRFLQFTKILLFVKTMRYKFLAPKNRNVVP